jgi:ubiquinone/menaquinone biosynthesis C-methylase UbiE
MLLPDSSILTNIQFAGSEDPGNTLFEKRYISIRSMENRLYTDEEVMRLPDIASSHIHAREWMIRKRSCCRLVQYLAARKKRLDILEAGCGNGWLAHRLSEIPGTSVTGLDINFTELQQAARVFRENQHLRFIYGGLHGSMPENRMFDVIVFAASIQYFRSLTATLHYCLRHLNPGGEIHLLDSHLYEASETEEARKRTFAYYDSLGYPEMSEYYFHHGISELQPFRHRILQNPRSLLNRLRGGQGFHWVCIKK